ncbi:beta-1,3-galactosyltransferase 6-like [Lineus longissimus]|uniref:beta-1,3-galactosyltransferase 6-like n=1 Tax=Lineus longissimus TaxID=88925 RepID=UPI00315D299D
MEGIVKPSVQRRLNRHATKILVGGIFLCLIGILFISICSQPASPAHYMHKDHDAAHKRDARFFKNPLENDRDVSFLVIMIITGPDNKARRETIRQTWLSSVPHNIKCLFVVGTKHLTPEKFAELNQEDHEFHDMLLLKDTQDAYERLTAKVVDAFTWLDMNVNCKFVLKVDDDTFVRVQDVYDELKTRHKEDGALYWGYFTGDARVKKSGPWKEPDWNLCDRYLPYARGGGYVLSAGLVHFIVANQKYFKKYKSEDVSIGAWLGPLEITKLHDQRFDTEYKTRGCSNDLLLAHKQSIEDMKEKHENLLKISKLCKKEEHIFESYVYDWNALPSKCCKRQDSKVNSDKPKELK